MKRHAKHRPDDTLEYDGDEKKAKTDDFEPSITSTQMNLTVSGFSNEMLRKLLDEKFEDEANYEEPKTGNLLDITEHDAKKNGDTAEEASHLADVALMRIKITKLEEEVKLKKLPD